MERLNLFAQAETTWAGVGMAVVLLAGQFFIWWSARKNAEDVKNATTAQTQKLTEVVKDEAKPLHDKTDTLIVQTNGITERSEAKSAELSEAIAVLKMTTEKLRKYDPNATVIGIADELAARVRTDTPK